MPSIFIQFSLARNQQRASKILWRQEDVGLPGAPIQITHKMQLIWAFSMLSWHSVSSQVPSVESWGDILLVCLC